MASAMAVDHRDPTEACGLLRYAQGSQVKQRVVGNVPEPWGMRVCESATLRVRDMLCRLC